MNSPSMNSSTISQSNSSIMDYSIHDAIEAGFNKVVFVIIQDIGVHIKLLPPFGRDDQFPTENSP